MFDLFNEHFYNMELTRPAITVSPDDGRGAYGWCSIHEIWNANEEKYREINLCAEYLDRPIISVNSATGNQRNYGVTQKDSNTNMTKGNHVPMISPPILKTI